MIKDAVIQLLKDQNPRASERDIAMYADYYAEYQEAQANITEYGAIATHPKTGSPIENPYIQVRNKAASFLQKMKLKTDGLWL